MFPTDNKGRNEFQDIDICSVFRPITLETFDIKSPDEGILALREAFETFKYHKKGPIHLNFPKNVLESYVDESIFDSMTEVEYVNELDSDIINNVKKMLEESKNPLILAGAGIFWSHASEVLLKFVEDHGIPVATTYHAKGVISEENPLAIGMIGLRGTEAANYAGKHCDLLMGLGVRFSERTVIGIGNCKIIHVNLDQGVLEGDVKIQADVKEFLQIIMEVKINRMKIGFQRFKNILIRFHVYTDFSDVPIKPQRAIKEILNASKDSVIVNEQEHIQHG